MMNASPLKEEFTHISVWVKLHDVPLHVCFEDGISLIATRIVLKESITMGIPLLDGSGFSKETVRVEYEWKSPRCDHCKIFGHVDDQCPKKATAIPTIDMTNDGFQVVVNKRKSGKTGSTTTNRSGVNVGKSVWQPISPKIRFESKNHGNSPKNGAPNMSTYAKYGSKPSSSFYSASSKKGGRKAPTNSSNISTSNPYDLLSQEFNPENYTRGGGDPNLVQDDMESEEEVEIVFDEATNLLSSSIMGASTYTAPDVFKT
nr:hypothetical protein [Tanacetum cinerariifolium]